MRQGWEQRKLGEVCSLITRGIAPQYINAGGVAVLNQRCVRDHVISFSRGRRHDVNAKRVDPERYLRPGDVLVNSTGTGTLGRIAQLRIEPAELTTVDSHVTIVRPAPGRFYPDFFGYILMHIEEAIANSGEGASGQTELARATLQSRFVVSFPTSLAEQQRIATTLDKIFAGLEKTANNTERNLKNSRELFDSHLNTVFATKGKHWEERRLRELIEIKHGFAFRSEFFKPSGKYVLLTPGNFFEEGGYRDRGDKQKYYVGEIPDGFILKKDDFLIAMTEQAAGLIGSSLIVPKGDAFLHNQRLGLVQPKSGVPWSNGFFLHAFNTKSFRAAAHESASGVKVRHTSPKKLGDLLISFPKSLEAQAIVARQLDDLKNETTRLAQNYELRASRGSVLTQAVLARAFAGELSQTAGSISAHIALPQRKASWVNIVGISPTDLHAGVIAIAFQKHQGHPRQNTFGRVKAEKIAHMVEAQGRIDLERNPIKDAAGPNDYPHLKKVESRAEKAGFFSVKQSTGGGYTFVRKNKFDALVDKTRRCLGEHNAAVDAIIDQLLPMDTEQAEILATVYAAWNNLLIDERVVTDEAIVREAREDWHPAKLTIARDRFFAAIDWMRAKGIVPTGIGKRVSSQRQR